MESCPLGARRQLIGTAAALETMFTRTCVPPGRGEHAAVHRERLSSDDRHESANAVWRYLRLVRTPLASGRYADHFRSYGVDVHNARTANCDSANFTTPGLAGLHKDGRVISSPMGLRRSTSSRLSSAYGTAQWAR